MRLKSDLWVKAYLRTVTAAGDYAAVLAHGDDARGTILIKLNLLDGTAALYGPAPPSLDASAKRDDGERLFALMHTADFLPEADVDRLATRERDFDPEVWIIETESRDGAHHLHGWLATVNKSR